MNKNRKDYDIHIGPDKRFKDYFEELLSFKDLIFFLCWRDLLVRFKQTTLGILWSIIKPLFTTLAFFFLFNKIGQIHSGKTPYIVGTFLGVMSWQLFSSSLSESSFSLLSNSHLISKVYFPRMIIPISTIFTCSVDFFIGLLFLVPLLIYYGLSIHWTLVFLPLFIGAFLLLVLGIALFMSALIVKYRDFRHVFSFGLHLLFYISPVVFLSEVVPDKWRPLYNLNPLVGLIEGFRWSILGDKVTFFWSSFFISLIFIVLSLLIGVWYFRKSEKDLVDYF